MLSLYPLFLLTLSLSYTHTHKHTHTHTIFLFSHVHALTLPYIKSFQNVLFQDDALIESLLCLLDIFTGLHFGVYSLKHQGIGGSAIEHEVGTDSSKLLQEALDPLDAFDIFLQVIKSTNDQLKSNTISIQRIK